MKKPLIIALTAGAVAVLAGTGIAVNAATLSLSPTSNIGGVPGVLMPTPSPTSTHDAGDDNLPRHSGLDDGADHDAGDDNPDGSNSGSGGSGDDSDSDNSGPGSDSSGSGSGGSDDSGSHDSGDDSGSGGHGSDD